MIDRYAELGVRMICTRTIGFNHIDLEQAKKRNIIVTHITYDPCGVAEFTVMYILMAVRKYKEVYARTVAGDFRLDGNLAGTLRDMSVGIVGAGSIGTEVLRDLSGFGCKLFYCNRSTREEADRYAERIDFDELLSRCDIISLHLELNDDTYHLMDSEAFAKMKDDSIIVNTARGPLIDTEALIDALDSGKISCAALDVIEDEFGLYYNDCRGKDLSDHYLARFISMPNVMVTHHMAFYYRDAVRGMIYNCLYGMSKFEKGEEIPLRLV